MAAKTQGGSFRNLKISRAYDEEPPACLCTEANVPLVPGVLASTAGKKRNEQKS